MSKEPKKPKPKPKEKEPKSVDKPVELKETEKLKEFFDCLMHSYQQSGTPVEYYAWSCPEESCWMVETYPSLILIEGHDEAVYAVDTFHVDLINVFDFFDDLEDMAARRRPYVHFRRRKC